MIQRQFDTAFRPFSQPERTARRARIGMIALGLIVTFLGLLNLASSVV